MSSSEAESVPSWALENDDNGVLSKHLFNDSEAERIPDVQPNSTLHDGWRKVAISIADLVHPISILVRRGMRPLNS